MIGVLLAGGAARRLGGRPKAALELGARPLIAYPAAALEPVCARLAVVCKPDSELPELDGVERWDEPARPRHPLTGIVHALERAGEAVLVCAADMPYVTPDACRSLIDAGARGEHARAAVAVGAGQVCAVFGVYPPDALAPLRAAPADRPLSETVEMLAPAHVALAPALLRSVNTREDLNQAEATLAGH